MLTGNVVVITGAAGGIGAHLCRQLAQKGAAVWALDINEKALSDLKTQHEKFGHEVYTAKLDVTCAGQVRAVRDQVMKTHGRIDVWINNAGLPGIGDFLENPLEEFQRVMKVNLDGVVFGSRAALEAMEKRGKGCIVNVASVAGHISAPYMTAYNASKHAVIGFSRALRAELRLRVSPVDIVLVSPGFVDTALLGNEGRRLRFPDWLRWALSSPESVSRAIVKAIERRTPEVYPTLNGKLMLGMRACFPGLTERCARVLLAESFSDFIFSRPSASRRLQG